MPKTKILKIIQSNHGIGLIEVMISISILGVGILGLLQAFPKGTSIERNIELATIAQHLAQAKIEEMISLSYEEILTGLIEDKILVDIDPNSEFNKFSRTTNVWLVDQNLQNSETDIGLKKIKITIFWPPVFAGPDKSASITTLISNK